MKTSLIQITNLSRTTHPIVARNCSTFLQNLKGLMFESGLPEHGGVLIDEHSESILNTSIHMLFMRFDITAVWIDSKFRVADVKLAKKWAVAYFPKSPARYVLEISAYHLQDFVIGDQLEFTNVS